MEYGVMFFSSAASEAGVHKYGMLLDAARAADEHGLRAVWTPERHFDRFGGLFPNPSLTSAALATVTTRVQLRAGSLISPLHDPLRIAEEWSVVDNLSNGRAAVSFGSGWNVNDFVFCPDRYAQRQATMFSQIETVQRLWRGESIVRTNGAGKAIDVRIQPRPVQPQLPIWITSSGNVATFDSAGAAGANILTHLIGQDAAALATKIRRYRSARAAHGFDPQSGTVSLMLHTCLGRDAAAMRDKAWRPLREYLRSAVALELQAARGGGSISCGHEVAPDACEPDALEELLDLTCERYLDGAALIGTPDSCRPVVRAFEAIGINEIACLIDFGVDAADALAGLALVAELQASEVSV